MSAQLAQHWKAPSDKAPHHGRRGAARARLYLPARAVSFEGTVSCTVLDISQTGAQIVSDSVPRVGAMLVIEMPPAEFFGTVSWVIENRFGMHFDEPLSAEAVVNFRRQADAFDNRAEIRALRLAAKQFVEGRI